MKPRRIQRKREKGWRMPENTVYVGRPGKFGNPFDTAREFARMHEVTREEAVDVILTVGDDDKVHKVASRPVIKKELRGKDLACWCDLDQECHADVLLKIANDTEK